MVAIQCKLTFFISGKRNMAWRCGGGSNNELVENLFKHNIIQSKQVSCYFQKIHVHIFTWGSTKKLKRLLKVFTLYTGTSVIQKYTG